MSNNVNTSPKFDSPPVIETVLGVEFRPLNKWSIQHFGLFWNRIREEFPKCEIQPPLMSQIEIFGQPQPQQKIGIQLMTVPEVRCWFSHSDQARLIQIQNDRFVHNWRKIENHTYPSYNTIKPKFKSHWETFCNFLNEENLGEPEAIQCEVTYINHIEIGEEWKSLADISEIVPAWSGQLSGSFLPLPETVQIKTAFVIPDDRGRLHINLQPAIRRVDLKQILQLTLTARGAPKSAETSAILEWFDLGHDWVVRGFADFTSEKMHQLWKRRR